MDVARVIERPTRWNHPFDPSMADRDIEWVLSLEPFHAMDRARFSQAATLEDIVRNDCRISRFEPGDIIVREGEYGSNAFIILRGSVRVLMASLDSKLNPANPFKAATWFKTLCSSLRPSSIPEIRRWPDRKDSKITALRQTEDRPRVFLQDVNAVINGTDSDRLGPGELFGELAAITRSSSNYTVVADSPTVILEIRWQGLRLMRRDPGFQEQLDARYREAGLKTHLRETDLFRYVPPEQLDAIARATRLQSFGDMEWFADYRESKQLDVQDRIKEEPVIIQEGTPANWLVLIRSGFARRSYQFGHGHRTMSYLGRGQTFGLDELVHNATSATADSGLLPYQESLRSIGFVDVLMVPRREFIVNALPFIREKERPKAIERPRYDAAGPMVENQAHETAVSGIDPSLLEFLVDHRLMNGRQAMVIDTDACTRCDDCVRACARTHDGNPRFVRQGPQFERFQITHACMHCIDPVCMIGCPTGAIARDTESGVVAINPTTCIGCKVCAESCPYENIVMVEIRDGRGRRLVDKESKLPLLQATKCDFCHSLPTGPACQAACPHDALVRINLSQPAELQSWINRKAA